MGNFSKFNIRDKEYKVNQFSVMEQTFFHLEFLSKQGAFVAGLVSLLSRSDLTLKKIVDKERKNNGLEPLPEQTEEKKEIAESDFIGLFGALNPEKSQEIIKKVLSRVYTPENLCLDAEYNIQNWFSKDENKNDYWLVVARATIELLGEQLPASLSSMIAGLKLLVESLLTSPTDMKASALYPDQLKEDL